MSRFVSDLPVYIILGGFLWFVIYVYIHSRQQERKNKEGQNKDKIQDKN